MMRSSIDQTDRAIIAALKVNARQTLAEIGGSVGLSAPAVKRRIDRLEELGVIVGYTIKVDQAKLRRPLSAFIELRFSGSTPVDSINAVAAETGDVESVFTIAGDPDALVHLRVANVDHMKDVIDRFRRSGKVTGTKTLVVLDEWSQR